MNYGEAIKGIRKEIGLSQKRLAELCGISATHLSRIEKEKQKPSRELLETIGKKLNVPLYYINLEAGEEVPSDKKDALAVLEDLIRKEVKDKISRK